MMRTPSLARRPLSILSLPALVILALGLFGVLVLNACLSDPKEKTVLEFRLDSTLVGRFDSVRVRILPASGDTDAPLLAKTFKLRPDQRTVTVTLPDDFDAPGFKVLLTGLKDGAVAFDKQYTYAEASQKPTGDPVDLMAVRDSVIKAKADSAAKALADSLAKAKADSAARSVIAADSLACFAGDSVASRVSVKPDSAADKGYALISNDTVKAGVSGTWVLCREVGTVTITVRARRDTVSAVFPVLIGPRVVRLKSIAIPATAAVAGDTVTLSPVLSPRDADDKRYILTARDTSVVRILDSLRILALAPGKTEIRAKALLGEAETSFTLEVSAKKIPPTALAVKDTALLLFDTLNVQPIFTPEAATERGFTLTSSDTGKVTVSGTSLYAKALGSSTLTVTSSASDAKSDFEIKVRAPEFADIQPITKKWCGKCHGPAITFNLQDSAVLVGRGSKALARVNLPVGNANRMPADTVMDKRDLDRLTLWLSTHVKPVTGLSAKDTVIAIGDTLTPLVTFTPSDATNRNYTLESGNATVIKVVGTRLVALASGTVKITVRSEDGEKTTEFTALAVTPRFEPHIKPITAEKCGKCHGPAVTFNLQDSSVLLIKGAETLRRVQLPKGDPAHMPAEGDLTPSQLTLLLGWLNAHFVPLDSVRVANDSVRLGDTKFPSVSFFPANASNLGYTLTSFDTTLVSTPTGVRIKGNGLGTALIGLTSEEGKKTKTFSIKVIAWPVDSLAGADTSLQVGDSAVPTVLVYPGEATNKAYTLASLQPASASITASGKVKALALGTAKIIATSVQQSTIKDTFTVVVGPVPVQSVSAANMSLLVGSTQAPVLTWVPAAATNKGYALAYLSGDAGIASVVGGTSLTGTAAGSAVFRVTSTDGSKTSDFTLTVGNVIATGITLNLPVLVAGTTVPTSATFSPSTTTIKTYTLATSNSAVLDVSGTQVVVKALGSANITAIAADGPTQTKTGTVIMPPFSGSVLTVINSKCSACHPALALPNWSDSTTAFTHRALAFDRINRVPGSAGFMPMGGSLTAAELKVLNDWFKW